MATATRTVVFTDLANYTQSVSRADRETLRKLLNDHEQFVHSVVGSHNGRIVKNLGDSFMVLFECATDAVRASLEVVERGQETAGLMFRASAATGDVEERQGDAFGEAVNMSARINAKTPAGEVWFSESTRLCMNRSEVPFEPVGAFPLKGIAGDTACFRAVTQDRCVLPDPIKAAVKNGSLVRIRPNESLPPLPPAPLLLFEGFEPGSPQLTRVMDLLPVLDPARLFILVYTIAPSDRHDWLDAGRGLVVGTRAALEGALEAERTVVQRPVGTNTIILDLGSSADLELVMAGLALPAVPLADVVAGYSYDLMPDGRWVNRSPRAVLRVEVTPAGVRAKPLTPNISIQGRASSGETPLTHGAVIGTPSGSIRFVAFDGPPYAGLLLSDSNVRMGISGNQVAQIGREPRHPGLALPDRSGQYNIRWCTGQRAARARESGFTLDRALAGRRQASVEMAESGLCRVKALHDRLATYLLANDALSRITDQTDAAIGQMIVTGTTVIALRPPSA